MEEKLALSAELEGLKEERRMLENSGAEKEKLLRQKQEQHQKQEQLQKIISDIVKYHQQQEKWEIARELYLAADQKSAGLLREYDGKNKAFLDEQAGIIAGQLEEGAHGSEYGRRRYACIPNVAGQYGYERMGLRGIRLVQR